MPSESSHSCFWVTRRAIARDSSYRSVRSDTDTDQCVRHKCSRLASVAWPCMRPGWNGTRLATAGSVDLSSELADHYRVKSLC